LKTINKIVTLLLTSIKWNHYTLTQAGNWLFLSITIRLFKFYTQFKTPLLLKTLILRSLRPFLNKFFFNFRLIMTSGNWIWSQEWLRRILATRPLFQDRPAIWLRIKALVVQRRILTRTVLGRAQTRICMMSTDGDWSSSKRWSLFKCQ